MISDKGLFLTCLLMRITRGRDNEIIAKLFTIMLTRAQNNIMMKCYLEDQKDEAISKDISLVNDEQLQEFIDLTLFILKKGLIKNEICKGGNP